MATIKSFTDIQQSKKLAKILPLESADMYYHYNGYMKDWYPHFMKDYEDEELRKEKLSLKDYLPCWSIAAVLGVLPNGIVLVKDIESKYYSINSDYMTEHYDNPIDACYEMIIKLELKML